jgi:mRNA interferase MazF
VPFPHTNRPVRQRRPALVVATHDKPGMPRLLWVLMITSAANRGWSGDVLISDIAEAGLPVESLVRTEKIATIEARDADAIGRLPLADRGPVQTLLQSTMNTLATAP